MKVKLRLLTILAVLVLVLLPVAAAWASCPPSAPRLFSGSVTIGGALAPIGTVVSAWIDGGEVGTTTTVVAGAYSGIALCRDGNEAKTVVFKVGGVVGGQTPFSDLPIITCNLALYTLTITIEPVGGGTVTRNIPGPNYPSVAPLTTVHLTAVPTGGYTFSHWEGALTGFDNPQNLLIDGNKAVTANFTPAATAPDISVDPTSWNFLSHDVGSSTTKTFTVSNVGTADLVVGMITLIGANADQFSIQNDNASGHTLGQGGSATLQVVFSPTSSGSKIAQLNIPSNDPDENPKTVNLSGTGGALPVGKCGPIDLVIVLDDTGSMSGVINSIIVGLPGLIDVANTASGGDLRLGYITFKDYVEVHNALTNDINAVKASIQATYASGGGGGPESSDQAKNTAVNNLPGGTRNDAAGYSGTQNGDFIVPYRAGALKIVVLITDAPPGGFSDSEEAADDAALHAYALDAKNNGILMSDIYIGTGGSVGALLRDDAETTGGVYIERPDGTGIADAIAAIVAECGGAPPAPSCTADFKAWPTRGRAPLDVQFTDRSTGDIAEWHWDFGDGLTSEAQNPKHTYTEAGKYDVTLGVKLAEAVTCNVTKTEYIVVLQQLPTEVVPESANLAASNLFVSPEQVVPNQEVEISIDIGNSGGTEGSRTVSLYINGEFEQSQMVTVGPGSAKHVVFTVSEAEAGTYQVMVEGKEGVFYVLSQEKAKWWAGPLSTPGIIVIVIVAIVLILALVFVLRRET